jgi:hypothetical protein
LNKTTRLARRWSLAAHLSRTAAMRAMHMASILHGMLLLNSYYAYKQSQMLQYGHCYGPYTMWYGHLKM